MTFQDDPNFNRPSKDDDPNYVPWTIGGAVALAVIVGIILLTGSRTDKDSMVANNPSPPAATKMAPAPATTPPATTGSAAPSAPPAR
jgi:hypothetical protein